MARAGVVQAMDLPWVEGNAALVGLIYRKKCG
jgi:hypothetical protein